MHRRHFLQAGASATLAALFARAAKAGGAGPPAPAKSVILLWMNGGPSHLDTWDPKPGTKVGGPFKAIRTATKGLEISEHLPKLAARSADFAVLRGVTAKEGNHQRARYLMHTGYAPNPTVQHPALGAWLSARLGPVSSGLPAFVSLGGPTEGGGFLGVQHGPFTQLDPGKAPDNTAPQTDAARFERRLAALSEMDKRFAESTGSPMVDGRRAITEQAVRLMKAPALAAFDASQEPDAVRAAYGDTAFGRGCLVARRLVESGVRFVEVVLDGWDTHMDNFGRVKALSGTLDAGMSTLLAELSQRKLLASTLVVWMGDFGRTPRINGDDGRDHFPGAQCAVVAGGGTRGGVVVGGTDADGSKPGARPVTVPDLLATVVSLAGVSPNIEVMTPVGRPLGVTDGGTPVREVLL
jgi:uncharacterized protein (DUF1501 family)